MDDIWYKHRALSAGQWPYLVRISYKSKAPKSPVFLPQEKGMNGMRINPRVMHSREARVATLQHSCSSGKQRERQ